MFWKARPRITGYIPCSVLDGKGSLEIWISKNQTWQLHEILGDDDHVQMRRDCLKMKLDRVALREYFEVFT